MIKTEELEHPGPVPTRTFLRMAVGAWAGGGRDEFSGGAEAKGR